MHERVGRYGVHGCSDVAHRLNDAELVVDSHHRHHLSCVFDMGHHRIDGDDSVLVCLGNAGRLPLGWFQDGGVFGRANDQCRGSVAAPDSQVV